jgi:hypothetical protein
VDSGGEEDAAAQEIEAGASVHLAFDQLELVDLPLCLSTAPRHRERRSDCRFILGQKAQACGKARSYVAAATHTSLSGAVAEASISLGFQGDSSWLNCMLLLP